MTFAYSQQLDFATRAGRGRGRRGVVNFPYFGGTILGTRDEEFVVGSDIERVDIFLVGLMCCETFAFCELRGSCGRRGG